MSALPASKSSTSSPSSVLDSLALRWRPVGLYLACFRTDGAALWQDPHMPRLLALSLQATDIIAQYISQQTLGQDPLTPAPLELIPGLQVYVVPITRRRKITAWLAVLARVGTLEPTEEIHRAASRAALDVQSIVTPAQQIPLHSVGQLPWLVDLVRQMHEDLLSANVSQNELAGIAEQLSSTYEEISLLYKISSQMRVSRKPQHFLQTVCHDMQDITNFHSIALVYAHKDEESAPPTLGEMAVQVGSCPLLGNELINALHAPLLTALRLGEAQIHNDLSGSEFQALAPHMKRFVCVPLIRETRPLGILIAVDKNDHSDFNTIDIKLLSNVANQCSIFLENAALFSDMEQLFMGVLHALTRSIDAKDTYTRGHSQRVADLSRDLARKIGLPEEQCERIYLSGLLHDVGKIGVPEAVLTKPGRLTDAEFEAIKKHPAIGAQILGNIKQLQDILPGVLYHHERWDGRGYPYGLAGDAIPLIGRIICVADSFDAMSSTRTYRPALPLETVLAEIQRCAGAQFDAALAKVFVTLDFQPYRRAVEEQLHETRPVDFNGGMQ